MTPEERNLISGLFDRLGQASSQPKDPEADQLIRSKLAEIPAAPYLLVQSILVMQQAVLERAKSNRRTRETSCRDKSCAWHSAIRWKFSRRSRQPFRRRPITRTATARDAATPSPSGSDPTRQPHNRRLTVTLRQCRNRAGRGGGGFLQGALTTAAGVAGGALLFQGIEGSDRP